MSPIFGQLASQAEDYQPAALDLPQEAASKTGGKSPEELEALAGKVKKDYTLWRTYRQAHEGDWFVNAAMLRGQQHVVYDQTNAQLITPDSPSYAIRVDFNKILPKHRARMAQFFKNRPKHVVVPASTDYQDVMDARATERVLNYQWARLRQES